MEKLSTEAQDLLKTVEPQPTRPTPLFAKQVHEKLEHERDIQELNEIADKNLDEYVNNLGASSEIAASLFDEFERLLKLPLVDEKTKRDDESMQEYSDRMDRLQRAKQKCQNCPHERGHHVFGDCGIGDCDCEKFVKREYVRPEHLSDRPLQGHEGLAALKAELDKSTPVSKKQNHRGDRYKNARANHPAGKGRNKKDAN